MKFKLSLFLSLFLVKNIFTASFTVKHPKPDKPYYVQIYKVSPDGTLIRVSREDFFALVGNKYCSRNGCVLRALYSCRHCKSFRYCSKQCLEEDFAIQHHEECRCGR